jgi:uncharacterized protein
MAHNESFLFPGPAGSLEALLMMPAAEPLAAAIVCHANPEEGGMMHFKVVFRAAKALQAAGAAVLRFNFRGVGSSQGAHDQGRGEQDDVKAALDEMGRRFPGRKQVLGGFSFGSVMAMAVGASDARAAALFALGFPARIDSMTARLPAMTAAARAVPRLFVQGDSDRFGGRADLEHAVASFPPPTQLVVIDGADHFFTDKLDALQSAVYDWAAERPWEGN